MTRFAAALTWLDLRIAAETRRLRARYELSLDELRGLFISDRMVDAVLAGTEAAQPAGPVPTAPLGSLVAEIGLDPQAEAALLVLLAPDLDPRYWTLYAYVNDDVARRWATPELVGRLLGAPAAAQFTPATTLVRAGLAVPADPADAGRPLLLRGWRAAPAVVHRALDLPGQHAPWLTDSGNQAASAPAPPALRLAPPWPALLVTGPPETGRVALAARHAVTVGHGTLLFRPAGLGDGLGAALAEALAAARLDRAMLVVDGAEVEPFAIPGDDVPVAVVTRAPGAWPARLHPRLVVTVDTAVPPAAARAAQWRAVLRDAGLAVPAAAARMVADRFRLTAPAIIRAARRLALAPGDDPLADRLVAAARGEAAADPGTLARRVPLSAGWDDLVLPAGALRQLRDFAGAIAHRATVFDHWGFAAVGRATGSGLAALFSGGSGTGKTMSAAVVAKAIGLDLWRIDLSAMVSKYIGETEKNLEKLFSASGAGDAILFFDEADAIFGKRSEVKDAHDRYANIEIAYLLQRLEEHEGVVILATNLSRNLDTAFLRRIPFVIDFPMPDPAARTRLWRKAIPSRAPLDQGVDFAALGARFELSGGDIRAAALEAGFLAAGNGGLIDRKAIEIAVARQLLKRGQLPAETPPHPGNGRQARPPGGAS